MICVIGALVVCFEEIVLGSGTRWRTCPHTRGMPFKHKELLVKAEQKLSGKDAKKLTVEASLRLSSPEDAGLLLRKGTDVVQRRTAGGVVCRIVDCDKVPVLFELGSSGLLPTLTGLWRVPTALPGLICPPEVARFLINGADLLLPGVRAADDAVAGLPVGAPACVRIFGNPAAIAVGVLVAPGSAVAQAIATPGAIKGVALSVEHVIGDALWRLAGRPLPNAGFTMAEDGLVRVASLESAAPDAMAAPIADLAALAPSVASATCAAGIVDISDPSESAEVIAEVAEAAPAAGTAETVEAVGEAESDPAAVQAEMDALMRACFLFSAKALDDASLPMLPNAFYTGHMRPKRPAGSSLDVKASSWKKLLPFLRTMESEGLCTLAPPPKGGGTEPHLKAICRSAEAFAHFTPWTETAEVAEARAAGANTSGSGGGGRLRVARVYRPSEAMRPLFTANGATDGRRFYDEAETLALLEAHVRRVSLAMGGDADGGKNWTLDPVLCDALFKGGDGSSPPTTMNPKLCRRTFMQRLESWTRVSGGALEKPLSTRGDPPKVALSRS